MPPARGPSTMADPADRDVTMARFGHNPDERSSAAPSRAGGVSLGPEIPIVAINVALAVWLGRRAAARVPVPQWVAFAAADVDHGRLRSTRPVRPGGRLPRSRLARPVHRVRRRPRGDVRRARVYAFPVVHRAFHSIKHPVALLTLGGLVLGVIGAIGGRIFPAVFVGVAIGLLAHQVIDSAPVALTISAAVLGIVLVVTRSGWLSLFMAITTVSQIAVLPVLCIALLPVWLLVTDRPELRIVEPTPPPAAVPGE
jgi:hypothetical protein